MLASKIKEKITNTRLIIAFLLLVIFVVVYTFSVIAEIDTDGWFLITVGREIAENGIPYTNTVSAYDGMQIVVQQWLHALILYWFWNIGDNIGIVTFTAINAIFFIIAELAAACAIRGTSKNLWKPLGFATATMLVLRGYITIRPSIISITIMCLVVAILAQYSKTGNKRLLLLLPLLACLHSNLHAAMAPYDVFIAAVWVISEVVIKRKRNEKDKADIKLLALMVPVMAISLAITPYGIGSPLYLINSFGTAAACDIAEMQSIFLLVKIPILVTYAICCIVSLIAIMIQVKTGKWNPALITLDVIALVLPIIAIRNITLTGLFSFLVILPAIDTAGNSEKSVNTAKLPLAVKTVPFIIVIAQIAIALSAGISPTLTLPERFDGVMEKIPAGTTVVSTFNDGGALEFTGHKVTMDQRPEIWQNAIAQTGRNYATEFINVKHCPLSETRILEESNAEYVLLPKEMSLLLIDRMNEENEWNQILNSKYYTLWQKKSRIITVQQQRIKNLSLKQAITEGID